jgi:hypothetical protein
VNASFQCDGTFSDVLLDDEHKQHPRTQFDYPDEPDTEELSREQQLKLIRHLEHSHRLVLKDGADAYQVFVRFMALTWLLFPNVTGAPSQAALLRMIGFRDKQQFNVYVSEMARELEYRNRLMRSEAVVDKFKALAQRRPKP